MRIILMLSGVIPRSENPLNIISNMSPAQGYTNAYTYPMVMGDFNGDGKTDVGRVHYGGVGFYTANPSLTDRVLQIENTLGGQASFGYTPSSQYQNYLLPFILQTVSSITLDDGFGNLSIANYIYSGGLFDYATREFRGFEYVKKTNPDGTTVESWSHQDEYRQGRQYQVDTRKPWNPEPDALLGRTQFVWETEPATPTGGEPAFVKLAQKVAESYDDQTVFTQQDFTYDGTNGNLLSVVKSGTDAETVTVMNQYQDFGDWVWRLTQETITGSASGKVRETYYEYETVTGNRTATEYWLDSGTNPRVTMTYDDYGNQVTQTDARGHTTTMEYDTDTHTFPVSIIHPATGGVGHVEEKGPWDYRFGKPLTTTDENGNSTTYTYDVFGRLSQIDYPNGGQMTIDYCNYSA